MNPAEHKAMLGLDLQRGRGRPRKRPEPKTATQQLAEFREAEKALADRLDRVRAVISALGG